MASIQEVLDSINEETFLDKLAAAESKAGDNGSEKFAMEHAPGSATAPTAQSTGDVTPGGPSDAVGEQLGSDVESERVKLRDKAMAMAAQQLASGVAATRGAGTDEGHNAALEERSGVQEYVNVPAPEAHPADPSQPIEADGAAKAASETEDGYTVDELEQEKFAAAREVANECIAQGLFVEQGFRMGLSKSAEDGEIAATLAPSILAAHEAALEKVSESDVIDKLASALAEKLAEKLGLIE